MEKTIEFLLKKISENHWNVTVIVKDAGTGAPIEGAKVEILGISSGLTDNQGVYEFTEVVSGSYQVSAEKEGYIKQVKSLELKPEEQPANLRGTITDSVTNSTLDEVKVALGSLITYSDHDGHYEFIGVSPGDYRLVFSKEGYQELVK